MAAARKTLSGFTLIELLVAVVITSLVIGIGTLGFSLFTQHWSRTRVDFDDRVVDYQRLALVHRALEDAIPWAVRGRSSRIGFYFLGREEGLTLVTSSPVFNPEQIAVIRFFRESDGSGGFRLVYEEAPLGELRLRAADQTLPFKHRLVVLESLRGSTSFKYFGWASVDERVREPGPGEIPPTPQWFDEYDGLVRGQHPQRISVSIDGGQSIYFVADRVDATLNRMIVE